MYPSNRIRLNPRDDSHKPIGRKHCAPTLVDDFANRTQTVPIPVGADRIRPIESARSPPPTSTMNPLSHAPPIAMKYNPNIHDRHSIRLRGYDYSQPGAYFVTICTYKKQCWFGEIRDGTMYRNQIGNLVAQEWLKSPQVRDNLKLDAWVVMPNHVHGIVWLIETRRGATLAPPKLAPSTFAPPTLTPPQQKLGRSPNHLGSFITGFKSSVTRQINQLRDNSELPIWQRNYYETIIRDEKSLHSIRDYINRNPEHWLQDEEHPQRCTEFTALPLNLAF